jgi:hypothetical protein
MSRASAGSGHDGKPTRQITDRLLAQQMPAHQIGCSGYVTNASPGMVLKLYARRFPHYQRRQQVRHVPFTRSGTNHYRFTATPTLPTRYRGAAAALRWPRRRMVTRGHGPRARH